MAVIDADAHVIECEHTWDFLDGAGQRFRPRAVTTRDGEEFWLIDGHMLAKATGDAAIPLAVREMGDVPGRLNRMDQLGIDQQVLYPTVRLATLTDRLEIQVALDRSYNRWMADACSRAGGRLHWLVAPPLLSLPDAMAEMAWGKANGAHGVVLRGLESDRLLSDPYLFPFYERAAELGLPFCIHVGNGHIGMRDVLFGDSPARVKDVFFTANLPVLAAFHLLIVSGIPERFPTLRWGFIEAGAEWVPYLLGEAARRKKVMASEGGVSNLRTALKDKNFWVALRTDNHIARLVDEVGGDNLVIGTDYGHKDVATEVDAMRNLRHKGEVAPEVADAIMGTNAARLYGLTV